MTSSSEYLEYILDLLGGVDGIEYRKMMGEYVLYCRGKVIGGVYDDRFLIKPTASTKRLLSNADLVLPYKDARVILFVNIENRRRIKETVKAMWLKPQLMSRMLV